MIELIEGDTGRVPYGTGTFGSRSMVIAGSAIYMAAEKILHKAKKMAAHMLEAAESDIEHAVVNGLGEFRVTGTDRRVGWPEVASAVTRAHNLPPGMEPVLHENAFFDPTNLTWSNGAQACEVEIAQGIGQALFEAAVYDRETGQLYTGSFMDYTLPRADVLPMFVSETDETQPCTHNPLGAKGCGESGTIGAPASITSAMRDALEAVGVKGLEMPFTAGKVWRAIREAHTAA